MDRSAKGLVVILLSSVLCFSAWGKGLFKDIPAGVPPQMQVCKGSVEQKAPSITDGENKVIFENGHFIFEIQKSPVLSIQKIFSRHTQGDCLNGSSRIFLIWADDKLVDINDFAVQGVKITSGGDSRKAEFLLNSKKAGIEVVLTVQIDKTPQTRMELAIKNETQNKNTIRVLFPYFENVLLGDAGDNYYYFPYKGGISSNKPYELSSSYTAHTGSIQLVSIYNPKLGGGFFTRVEDNTGRPKTFVLTKKDKNGAEEIGTYRKIYGVFEEVTFKHTEIFPQTMGSVLGCYSYYYDAQPNQSIKLPAAVFGVHSGNFMYALDDYSKWMRTWFKHTRETPEWYRKVYYYPVAHDILGNTGWEKGFLKDGKIAIGQLAKPYEHAIQLAYWGEHPKDDHLGDVRDHSWYRYANPGDYNYEEEWGGVAALREDIAKAKQNGTRVTLYGATQYGAWLFSKVYQQHPDWAQLDKVGNEIHEYWWDLNDNKDRVRIVNMCGQVEEWQDWVANTNKRIVEETGTTGIYLDVMNQIPFCYNPKHKHDAYPYMAAEKLLKKNLAAVRSANPEAVIESEDFCSDYLLQWTDGCWMKTFYQDLTLEFEQTFNIYDVSFVRFLVPDVKWTDFGPRWIYGSRRAFFNGIGYNISEVTNKTDPEKSQQVTKEQRLDYLIRTCQLLKENGDAFSSMDCKPLVPTLPQQVYANYFGTDTKKIYTIYNKNGSDISGPVINGQNGQNYHFIELLYDEEASYDPVSDSVSLSISPWDVVCIAKLPKLLQIENKDGKIVIKTKRNIKDSIVKILDCDDDGKNIPDEYKLQNGKVVIDAGKYQNKHLIIKLFVNDYLADERILN
jgi:hypothetical protein